MLNVTSKMEKNIKWDEPFWALRWDRGRLFAPAVWSEMEVLDRACRRPVDAEVQLQRNPRLGLSKKLKGHMGSQPFLAAGVLKPFSVQVVQVRVRETFAGKHRAPSWRLSAASQ